MKLTELKPRQALNKAYLKVKPIRSEIEHFKTNLIKLLDKTKENESEEFHKNLVSDFLKDTYYKQNHFINTKDRNDLVIHNGPNANSSVGVIIEAKRPTAKHEMVSRKNLNAKAFQELVYYYLGERIKHKNLEVKHLIITNKYEWFIFDVQLFERLFAQNSNLVKQFNDFQAKTLADSKTDFFYKQIAEPFIAATESEVVFTYFNLLDYEEAINNKDKEDDNKLIALFKLLSPEHLLKLPFTNDSNSLDKRFYSELLHIIGLTETKEGNKKLIERNKENQRNSGSLLEDAIIQLDSLDKLNRLERPIQYGNTQQERLFNVGLELSITWINRILFLKLLEAQLLTYHKGDKSYAFLNKDRIKSYDDLNSLFFQVLARKYDERNNDVKKIFEKVPYLNSSLFEPTEIEQVTLFISNLREDKTLPILSTSVLKNEQGKKRTGELPTLEYLFEFLNAYDFAGEGTEEIQEDNKSLINASVLGLIFEKINGYKDGSFFTPGFITMYMCRETIRKAVVQKFNETKNWDCKDLTDLGERLNKDNRVEANNIINSLKICDPAVGSGHFLVSALNEIISIKSDLEILIDGEGKRLKNHKVEVVNDELIVTDEDGELFEYNPKNAASLNIQKTLFHEKQTIIEHCLFGVDINPNSVKICRLRLWIELLKNAYYKNETELETLPNIDINIKCGNSLVSRFAMDADLSKALKKSKWTIDGYRIAVQTYRNAANKEEKREMEKLISNIKSDFRSEIDTPFKKSIRAARGKVDNLATEINTRKQWGEKADKKLIQEYESSIEKLKMLEADKDDILSNRVYENAFEWRFEFPEVLNLDGDFIGFDVVIGNPPYIRQEEIKEFKPFLKSNFKLYSGLADIYIFFIERGFEILKNNGAFTFIIPNKFMQAGYGQNTRRFLLDQNLIEIVDFGDYQVFEEATTYPCILMASKNFAHVKFKTAKINSNDFKENFVKYIDRIKTFVDTKSLNENTWIISNKSEQLLIEKLKSTCINLQDYLGVIGKYGIKTGLTEAFVISTETKDRIIEQDSKSSDLIKPFLLGRNISAYCSSYVSNWLILIPKGFTIRKNLSPANPFYLNEPPPRYGNMEIDEAWDWFKKEYPAIANHLLPFKEKAEKRTDKGDYWWELRACDYYEEFEKDKIMYQVLQVKPCFILDTKSIYCNNSMWLLPTNDKSLLGILNSKMGWWLISKYCTAIQNGYQLIWNYFGQIPIAKGNDKARMRIIKLVDQIIDQKKSTLESNTSHLESQIDQLVYQLYGLTEEEIKIVEGK